MINHVAALKSSAEYRITAQYYEDQASVHAERYPQTATVYYEMAIACYEHAATLIAPIPAASLAYGDIQQRLDMAVRMADFYRIREPRGEH